MNELKKYWYHRRDFRDAVFGSFAFGTIGWLAGGTIPGSFNHASNLYGGLLFFMLMFGTIGWIVGFMIGATVERSVKYYQGEVPDDAAPEPTA